MKTKKGSRILALLLSLVMLLGSLPTAFAEGEGAIIKDDAYDAALAAAVERFYEDALACEHHSEFVDLINSLSEDQYNAVRKSIGAIDGALEAMDAHDWELLLEMIRNVPVNVTNAAPLLMPAVYYPAVSVMKFAATRNGTDTTERGDAAGLELSKVATQVSGGYQIQLEAYTTGNVQSTSKTVPCDIVLVLDESGSMAFHIGKDPVYASELDTSKDYYIMVGDYARKVEYSSSKRAWRYNNNSYTPKASASDTTSGRVQFYETYTTRQVAITTAVNSFLADVRANNATITGETGHRVGIIGFDNENSDRVIRSLDTNLNDIGSNTLGTNGGTFIDDGLDAAITMLANSNTSNVANQKRNRVVIAFTDGNPGTGSWSAGDSMECAVNAVNYANTIKKSTESNGYGATLYTIGIFEGANPSDTTGESNRFMNAVSSNYPTASGTYSSSWYGSSYTINLGNRVTGNYYLAASDSNALNSIFSSLAGVVGAPSITVSSSAVIKDIIAPSFILPEGATVTLQTADRTEEGGWANIKTAPSSVTYSVTKNATGEQVVSVTGFDYAKNYVADVGRDENDTTKPGNFFGRKLIITFTIETKTGFLGGNEVPTNGEDSGFYADASATEALEYFDIPVVNEPVQRIKPTIIDDHIYLSNAADLERLVGLFGNTDYYEYQIVDANGNVITDKNGKNTYGIDGDLNGHVTIQYLFEDETGKDIATFTVQPGANSGTLSYFEGASTAIDKDTEYNVTCTVIPKVTAPTKDEYKDRTYYTEKSMNAAGTVYVYKPVLTFKDSAEKYDTENSIGADSDKAYFNGKNFQTDLTYWYNSALQKTDEQTGSLMDGTEPPSVSLEYTSGALLDGTTVDALSCVSVNVSAVTLTGDPTRNYFNHTSTVRATCDCKKLDGTALDCANVENHHANMNTVALAANNTPEFIVHVYDVYGHLQITKTVKQEEFESGSFTFEVKDAENEVVATKTIALNGKDNKVTDENGVVTYVKSVIVENLLPGDYTVTETTTDNYDVKISVNNSAAVEAVETEVTVEANKTARVGVVNTANIDYDVTVTKVWVDNNNKLGYRPDTITLTLKGDEGASYKKTETFTVDKNTNTATYTFENVPMYDDDGNIIEYSVEEAAVEKYDTTYNGLTVTNSVNVGHLQINKTVKQSDFTGGTFTFSVTGPNGYTGTASIVLDGNNKTGSTVIRDLLPGSYTVTETSTKGYSVNYDPQTVTVVVGQTVEAGVENTANSNHNVTVTKVWDDNNNNLGHRPAKISLTLTGSDGQIHTQEFAVDQNKTEDASTAEYIFNVPKYDANGNIITYTVDEPDVPKYYKKSISGMTVTNSIDVGHIRIEKAAIKEKGNEDNIDTLPNEDFEFELELRFGNKELTGQKMTRYNAQNQIIEEREISNGSRLQLKAGEYVIIAVEPDSATFRVTEINPNYFTNNYTGSTKRGEIKAGSVFEVPFENVYHKRKTGDLTITKNLIDASFTEGTRTFNFNVKLNDTDTFAQQQFGEWAAAKGLTVTDNSVTVPITVDASTTKEASVTLTEVTLAEKKGNLPAGTYGLPVGSYTVTEVFEGKQRDYYTSVTSAPENGTVTVTADDKAAVTVTNTADLYNEVKVKKVWDDESKATLRPQNGITVTLTGTANGQVVYSSTIENWKAEGDEWTHIWTNVPKKTLDGTAITYTVSEEQVTNYEAPVYGGNVESGFTVTNTIERTSMTIEKKGAVEANETFVFEVATQSAGTFEVVIVGNGQITINNLMVGEEVTVTEDMSWAWRYNATYDPAQTITLTANADNNEVKVTNSRKTDQWIDGNTSAENIFGTTPKPNVTTRPANNQ